MTDALSMQQKKQGSIAWAFHAADVITAQLYVTVTTEP